jgi:hypothetical protein
MSQKMAYESAAPNRKNDNISFANSGLIFAIRMKKQHYLMNSDDCRNPHIHHHDEL